jgi:hypothetical protein
MEMGANPKSLEKGPSTFQASEHLMKLCMWRGSRQISKKECNIFDNSGKWLMGGKRTADNCYGLPGLTTDP